MSGTECWDENKGFALFPFGVWGLKVEEGGENRLLKKKVWNCSSRMNLKILENNSLFNALSANQTTNENLLAES